MKKQGTVIVYEPGEEYRQSTSRGIDLSFSSPDTYMKVCSLDGTAWTTEGACPACTKREKEEKREQIQIFKFMLTKIYAKTS